MTTDSVTSLHPMCWRCLHTVLNRRVYVTVERPSVRPPACPVDRQQQRRQARCCWLRRRLQQISADSCLRCAAAPALSSKCGQRHVHSRRRRLNTRLVIQKTTRERCLALFIIMILTFICQQKVESEKKTHRPILIFTYSCGLRVLSFIIIIIYSHKNKNMQDTEVAF